MPRRASRGRSTQIEVRASSVGTLLRDTDVAPERVLLLSIDSEGFDARAGAH